MFDRLDPLISCGLFEKATSTVSLPGKVVGFEVQIATETCGRLADVVSTAVDEMCSDWSGRLGMLLRSSCFCPEHLRHPRRGLVVPRCDERTSGSNFKDGLCDL